MAYTNCDACGRLFTKGNYCPVCLKVSMLASLLIFLSLMVCRIKYNPASLGEDPRTIFEEISFYFVCVLIFHRTYLQPFIFHL